MYLFPKLPKLQKQLYDPSHILAIRSAEIVTRMPSHHHTSSFHINNLPLPLRFELPSTHYIVPVQHCLITTMRMKPLLTPANTYFLIGVLTHDSIPAIVLAQPLTTPLRPIP